MFFLPKISHSSYYAACNLKIKINKVLSAPVYSNRYKKFKIKASFTISNVVSGSGHNPLHCRGWEGKRFTTVLYFKNSATVSKIKVSNVLPIKFVTMSGKMYDKKTKKTNIWNNQSMAYC